MSSEFRQTVNSICAALPGAQCSDPWGGGHHSWKIADKMFACIGVASDGVSLKTRSIETASMLIEAGIGIKARYFHRSWIHLEPGTDLEELTHRIHSSYDLIRANLPKKKTAELPAREGGA